MTTLVKPPIHDGFLNLIVNTRWDRLVQEAPQATTRLSSIARDIIEDHVSRIHALQGVIGGTNSQLLASSTVRDYARILYSLSPIGDATFDQLVPILQHPFREAYFSGLLMFLEPEITSYQRLVEGDKGGDLMGSEGTNQETLTRYLAVKEAALANIQALHKEMYSS